MNPCNGFRAPRPVWRAVAHADYGAAGVSDDEAAGGFGHDAPSALSHLSDNLAFALNRGEWPNAEGFRITLTTTPTS